ncbi:anti-sigma factor [Rhizobium sp. P38BS-XIX]|uniref:anti-sigma factor n=1 Tax=Rhizobium sp. P38BS-XIX TaxID=2726740 RepID=UPI0014578F7D|nr:anti-sigma factor [Rhizobium sp. P38BS-XIX]NLR97102.1 anti-sigma factor [Rhizobium sp. P38BS-XIX]
MTSSDQDDGAGMGRREQDEILAGEYVLGVLSLAARRRVEARMVSDRAFAILVERWQLNLGSFNEDYEEQQPRSAVFENIERRLFGQAQSEAKRAGLWESIGFWRGFSVAASAAAIAAIGYISVTQSTIRQSDRLVAELSAPGNPITLHTSFDPSNGHLQIIPVASESADKSLQLWLVPGSGKPKSLGVFQQGESGEMVIPADLRAGIGEGATLAVSLEPLGGSPTGLPTGPVVASGSARRP